MLRLAEGGFGGGDAGGMRRGGTLEDLDLHPRRLQRIGRVSHERREPAPSPTRRLGKQRPDPLVFLRGGASFCLGGA